jgi:hypothetical protein
MKNFTINIIWMIKSRRMGGGMCWMEEKCHNILVGKPEGKKPLVRQRHRREDNIKIDFKYHGR